ncbi:MAG: lytic transglycosylase domain-containing protein [Selenomonadaceae bacterium]|nr:lytic transglycosylase domain-containing protein [Selenomonadaceae bacterium]
MVDLGHISEIRQRISEIQQQIGFSPKVPGMDFSSRLQKEMNKLDTQPAGTAAVPGGIAAGKAADGSRAATGMVPAVSMAGSMASALPTGAGDLSVFMDRAARKYDVDPRLVSAVAEVESGNDPSAVSGAGAIGVMQLMPDTAAALGVDPYDAEQNIEGGTKYLRQMLDSFGGDVRKALAAYNAGPQAVRDYNGVPPYSETQDYVNKVLDIYR